ncbi:hypothetical protein U9M48_017182 [Paspalum notatum var. saurae]|uniref:Reverse transcriptase domain-containing protein n=1 Tax=Paspalum notatum var. saurae TaxID=547442 RepID=A0AAQ3T707_PASNO
MKCLGLSSLERTIAQQRSRIRHLSNGDANTKYFHVLARGKKKRTFIQELHHEGHTVVSHDDKLEMLQGYFEQIFGVAPSRQRVINLEVLGFCPLDLSSLEEPFSEAEVLSAIKELPADRAPGPDGFTGAFYKASWSYIKADLLAALNAFHSGYSHGFDKLNNGLIVLLPKKQLATGPGDFRPIAMIHSFGKLVSKILAMRLAPVMHRLVASNQTAYIKKRSILDGYKFVQGAMTLICRKKIPKMLLKLDISKAFDSLAWSFLLEVLRSIGFGSRWRNWISILLSSASSKILVNGVPGQAISHMRGVHQGDSLSPILFVLAMEVLNSLFRRASTAGVLVPAEPPAVMNQCCLYADDVILFMSPTVQEANAVKELLGLFSDVAGLKINLSKSSVSPIFECTVSELPVTYLGLPLHYKKLPKACTQVLIDKVANRLPAWQGSLMARSGRLVWIKSVMLAVPIYAMMANALPPWARREIMAICRRFFWAGADSSVRGKCAVNWPAVARPFEHGGLGVLDLRLMGFALSDLLILLCPSGSGFSVAQATRHWSSLPLNIAPEVRCLFDASTHWVIGNGESTLFWVDKWIDDKSIGDLAPALLSLVAKRTHSTQTVARGLSDGQWIRELTGALSVQAIVQYLRLWERLHMVSLQHAVQDRLIWCWSQNGEFLVRSAYLAMHAGSLSFPRLSLIWKTWAPLRVKIFLWLAWRRRHWTGDRRRRHGLEARLECFLCDAAEESGDHLFFRCSFTVDVWHAVLNALGLACPSPAGCEGILDWWDRIRELWPSDLRRGGDSLFALVTWQV